MEKFNWGGNGATLGRLARTKIMLPVNKKNKPDFEYMEQYMKNLTYKKVNQYLSFINYDNLKLSLVYFIQRLINLILV